MALVAALLGCSADPIVSRDVPSVSSDTADAALPPPDVSADVPSVSSDIPAAPDDSPAPACGLCATRAEPETSGFISDEDIEEISGIVESRSQPGVYFVHNDSGDSARFFAIDGTGALRGAFVLRGATAVDWEDVAVGPCPAGDCLYFGDVGDNDRVRSNYALYRVPEPTVAAGAAATREVTWERFPFAYPDGRHNAEALAVRPDTGDVYVITKVTTLPSAVYRFPNPLSATANALVRVGELALPNDGSPMVTGADIHPCEPRLLVRTYTRLWEFTGPGGASWEDVFRAAPRRVLVQTETQGEAVGWHANGRGYVTVGEGRGQGLHDARCPR